MFPLRRRKVPARKRMHLHSRGRPAGVGGRSSSSDKMLCVYSTCPHEMMLFQWGRLLLRDCEAFLVFPKVSVFRFRLEAAPTPTWLPNPSPNRNVYPTPKFLDVTIFGFP